MKDTIKGITFLRGGRSGCADAALSWRPPANLLCVDTISALCARFWGAPFRASPRGFSRVEVCEGGCNANFGFIVENYPLSSARPGRPGPQSNDSNACRGNASRDGHCSRPGRRLCTNGGTRGKQHQNVSLSISIYRGRASHACAAAVPACSATSGES